MSRSKANLSNNVPGSSSLSSSNKNERISKITFISYENPNPRRTVKMYENKTKASANNLLKRLLGCLKGCSMNSRIKEVAVLKGPVECLPTSFPALYHAFVLLYIEDYFMTLERQRKGLVIQIFKEVTSALKKYENHDRKPSIRLIISDHGNITIKQLSKFIARRNFAFEKYDILKGIHCKKFAANVFNKVAETKRYNWKTEQANAIIRAGFGVAGAAGAAAGTAVDAGFFLGPLLLQWLEQQLVPLVQDCFD